MSLPFWFPNKNNIAWYIIFCGLFLMSLDFWDWYKKPSLFIGLPIWVWYLLILTLFTSVAFYAFAKYHWSEN